MQTFLTHYSQESFLSKSWVNSPNFRDAHASKSWVENSNYKPVSESDRIDSAASLPGNITDRVSPTSKHKGGDVELLDEINAFPVALDAEVEAAETVIGQGIGTTLEDNSGWLIVVNHVTDDRLEDLLIAGVIHAYREYKKMGEN